MLIRRLAVTCVLALAPLHMAGAAEDIVKPDATPPPAAGPTVAAAQAFCGDAPAKASELFTRYSTSSTVKEVYKSADYIAYSDDPKNSTVMYTFTQPKHAAHPAAVCRKLVKEGDAAIIKMHVICDGEKEACTKLQNDFNVMTAKMQAEVDNQIKAAAGK
ncbi:MAG: hypothetical protein ACRCS9_04480 [Hyphomicrobium sp.]